MPDETVAERHLRMRQRDVDRIAASYDAVRTRLTELHWEFVDALYARDFAAGVVAGELACRDANLDAEFLPAGPLGVA